MTRAAMMLAEANTIQKAKELKDLALTAQDWARRKSLGETAVNHCRKYALEAERKMGEMLKETPRNKGAITTNANSAVNPVDHAEPATTPPTLKELGLTKHESAKAQKLAEIPEEKFAKVVEGETSLAKALKESSEPISKNTPPPRFKPAHPIDALGKRVPEKLLSLWNRGDEIQEMLNAISKIRAICENARETKDKLYAELNFSNAMVMARNLFTELKATKPYCVCPLCNGAGCRTCEQRGLLGKFRYDTVVPNEVK